MVKQQTSQKLILTKLHGTFYFVFMSRTPLERLNSCRLETTMDEMKQNIIEMRHKLYSLDQKNGRCIAYVFGIFILFHTFCYCQLTTTCIFIVKNLK